MRATILPDFYQSCPANGSRQRVASNAQQRYAMHIAELKELQAALVRAFSNCTDLSKDPERGITDFVPHFSLGQWKSAADAEAAGKVSCDACC